MVRVVTGLILLVVVLGLLFWPSSQPFAFFLFLLGVVGLYEFGRLSGEFSPWVFTAQSAGLAILFWGTLKGSWPIAVAGVSLPLVLEGAATVLSWEEPTPSLLPIATLGSAGIAYLGGPLALALMLKGSSKGLVHLLVVAAAIWVGDTAAYYGGRRFGVRALHPASPKKTWEGTLCGLAGGGIAAGLVASIGGLVPFWWGLGSGLAINAMGQVGDLFESFLKRRAGVKDSGSIFPGHGGVLDRIDSLLFALPCSLLLLPTYWR
jgi:phosphatidate cytidylyltransferase